MRTSPTMRTSPLMRSNHSNPAASQQPTINTPQQQHQRPQRLHHSATHHHQGSNKKELGVLMLLLAAETVADCCATTDVASLSSTELIARSVVGMDHSLSLGSVRMMNNKVLSPSEPYDSVSSTGGDSETATPVPESNDCESENGAAEFSLCVMPMSQAFYVASDLPTVSHIMGFLDWRENLQLRRVSRTWFEASLSQAMVCRMPVTSCPAVFLPCHHDLEAHETAEEARYSKIRTDLQAGFSSSAWMCNMCGWFNERRHMCGNRSCHALAPMMNDTTTSSTTSPCSTVASSITAPISTRIFLGQLRREASVPLIRWLFEEVLLEPTSLLMVENHRHKLTGRGKGCAWVYVRNDGLAVDKLLSYHRRLFFDVVNGIEGAWIVHPEHTEAFAHEISVRGYAHDRPRTMPRNALVTELPLAQVLHMNMMASSPNHAVGAVDDAHRHAPTDRNALDDATFLLPQHESEPAPATTTAAKSSIIATTASADEGASTTTTTRRVPAGLSPFAVPFNAAANNNLATPIIAAAAAAAAPPSYAESVLLDSVDSQFMSCYHHPVHMISPTVRRHNPYAAATVSIVA